MDPQATEELDDPVLYNESALFEELDVEIGEEYQHQSNPRRKWRVIIIAFAIFLFSLLVIAGVLVGVLVPLSLRDTTSNPYRDTEITWKYGIVMDMGSTGTRIQIYQWSADGKIPIQPSPADDSLKWYKSTAPGIASYYKTPDNVAGNIEPLLEYAKSKLKGRAKLSETPLLAYGTAGLRVLDDSQAEPLLNEVRKSVRSYGFISDSNWTRVITGKQEGILDWLSVQQTVLLEKFDQEYWVSKSASLVPKKSPKYLRFVQDTQAETVGIIDWGGGSMEISFAADPTVQELDEFSELFAETLFDSGSYQVYGTSFLGYGHRSIGTDYYSRLINEQLDQGANHISDPCSLVGYESYKSVPGRRSQVLIQGTGDWRECQKTLSRFYFEKPCGISSEFYSTGNCSLESVYQPFVEDRAFLAMSTMGEMGRFFNLGGNPVLESLLDASKKHCSLTLEQAGRQHPSSNKAELNGYCFTGMFGYNVLTTGFGFSPKSTQILFTTKLYYESFPLSWTMGAVVDGATRYHF